VNPKINRGLDQANVARGPSRGPIYFGLTS